MELKCPYSSLTPGEPPRGEVDASFMSEQPSRDPERRPRGEARRVDGFPQAHSFAALARIGAVVVREGSVERIARAIVDQFRQAGASMAHVHLLDPDRRRLGLIASDGIPPQLVEQVCELSLDSPLLAARAANRKEIQVADLRRPLDSELTLAARVMAASGSHTVIAVPLIVHSSCVGTLTLGFPEERVVSDEECETFVAIGEVFASGISSAQARAQLDESTRKVDEIIETAPVGMAIVGLDGTFERANRALCEMLGYTPEELGRIRFQDVTHPDDLNVDLELAERLRTGEIPNYRLSKRYVHKNGAVIHAILSGSAVRDENGYARYYIAQIVDMSEARRREEALAESEERFRLMAENARDIVFRWSLQTNRFDYLSGATRKLLGYAPEEFDADPELVFRLMSPETRAMVRAMLNGERESRSPVRAYLSHRDGSGVCHEIGFTPVVHDERIVAVEGISRDITERERSEQALAESERRLAFVAAHAPGTIFYQDTRLFYTWFARIRPPFDDSAVGRTDLDLFRPDQAARIVIEKRRVIETRQPSRCELEISTGERNLIFDAVHEPRFDDKGAIIGLAGYWTDITDRIETERRLRLNEERLREAQEVGLIGSWYWDLRTNEVQWSDEAYRLFGFGEERPKITYPMFLSMVNPDDRPRVEERVREALSRQEAYEVTHRIQLPDGRERFIQEKASIVGPPGRPERLVGTTQDVTEQHRKEAERESLLQSLDEEKRWFEALINHSPNGIILVKRDGSFMFNRRTCELFGVRLRSEGGAAQFEDLLFHIDGSPLSEEERVVPRVLRGNVVRMAEYLVRRPDGSELYVYKSAAPILDDDQNIIGAVMIFEDISEKRALEQTRERWTGVIAHDLRQPLTTVLARVEMLRHRCTGADPEVMRELDHMHASAALMNRIIGDMVDASKIEAHQLSLRRLMVDLREVACEAADRFAALGITIRVTSGEQPALAFADKMRMEQVLSNLLSNAVKYGVRDGAVAIDVRSETAQVRVSVVNDGELDRGAREQLFERYHRSRVSIRKGIEGTGLGLYIVKGIVEAHGGLVGAESGDGKTTFWFTIPKVPG